MKIAFNKAIAVTFLVVITSTLLLNILMTEYIGWTKKLACYDKCETLGFESCVLKTSKSDIHQHQCNGINNNDIIVLVLN